MAVADQRLKKEDILKKFIISAKYGTSGVFPSGRDSTIVLCEVSWKTPNNDNWEDKTLIRSNGDYRHHAETKVLQDLTISAEASEIKLKLIQNYSPCNDEKGGVFCANEICEYKKRMEENGKKVDITIRFANFYRAVEYKTLYQENDAERAMQNKQGIRLLIDSGVKIELLAGEDKWNAFLTDNQLVNLDEKERDDCLRETGSDERKEREEYDKKLLREIRALRM